MYFQWLYAMNNPSAQQLGSARMEKPEGEREADLKGELWAWTEIKRRASWARLPLALSITYTEGSENWKKLSDGNQSVSSNLSFPFML